MVRCSTELFIHFDKYDLDGVLILASIISSFGLVSALIISNKDRFFGRWYVMIGGTVNTVL